MEEQNKKERFSIRKLSIGAASVLIGFAFMGMGAQTVQADQVTSTVKQEAKAADDQAEQKDAVKIDQPAVNTPAAEQITTPKTGEVPKQATEKQVEATVKPATETKNNNSEQNKKPQAVNKNDAKKVQTGAQDQTAKNDSAATEPNKQNSTTAETHEAQKVTGQTTQADQSQNRTSNSESTTNDQHNANSGNVELAKNDQVRDQNRQVTDKTTDVENAVSQLQKAMDQATVLANKTNLNKNLTTEQKSQLQQIDEIVSSGQALTASLRSNPENSDNRGNGNSVNGQTLNVSRLSKMTHNLNGLMTRVSAIENVDTADTKYADSWDKFVTAFEDTNVKTIYLTKDISADEITRSVTNSSNVQRNITIDGQNHFLTIHSTSGTSAFNFSNTITPNITFKDITLKGRVNGSGNGGKNDIFSTEYYFGTSNTRPTFTFENNVKLDHIVFAPMYAYQRPLRIIECPNFVIDGNVSVNDEFDHTVLHVISNVLGINIVCVFGKSNSFSLTEEGKLTGKNISIYADNISIKGDIDAQNVNFVGNQLNIENNARVDIDDTDNTINSNLKPLVFSSSPSLTGIGGTSLSGLGGMNVNISGNAAVNLKVSQAGLLSVRGQMSTIKTAGNSTLAVESDSPLIRGTSLSRLSSNLLNGTNNSLIKLTDTSSSGNIILVSMNGYINGSRNSVISATNMIIQSEHGHLDFGTSDYYVSGDKIEITSVGEKPYVFHHTYGSGLIRNMTVDQSGAFGDYDENNKDNINTRGLADHLYKYGTQYEYNHLVGDGQAKRITWGDRAEIIAPTTDAGITNAHDLTQNAHYNQLSSLSSQKGIDNDYYKNYFNPTQTVTFANNAKPTVKWVNGIIKRNGANGSYKYNDSYAGVIDPETGKLRQNSHEITDNDIGNATIEITYADGTKDYVPVTIDIKKAIAKPGSVTTPAAADSATNPIYPSDSSQTDGVKNPTAAAAASVIDGTDVSQWNPSYEFVDDSGNGISSFPTDSDHVFASPTDPDHYKVIKTNVKVNYKNSDGTDDGYQIIKDVYVRVKKTLADQFSSQITARTGLKVLDGATPTADEALDYGNMTPAQKAEIISTSPTNDPTNHSITYTISFGHNGADGSLTRTVNYTLVPRATAKTGLTFNADGHETTDSTVTIANGNRQGEALLNWGSNTTELTGQTYSVSGLTYTDNTNTYLHAGAQTPTVKVQLADDVITTGASGITTDASGHKTYNVSVPITINSMDSQYANNTSVANDQHVTVHVIKNSVSGPQSYQDPTTIAGFENPDRIDDLIKITGVDHSSSVIDHIEWASPLSAADQISNGDSSKFSDGTLKVVFKDGSSLTTSNGTALAAKIDVVGGIANTDSSTYVKFDSGSNPSAANLATKAKAALTNASTTAIGENATYSWDSTDMPDTTYDATDSHHNSLDRQATVVITYHDYDSQNHEHTSVQKVKVHYAIVPQADNFHGQITVNRGYVHIGEKMTDAQGPLQDQFADSTFSVSNNGQASTTLPTGWTWNGWMVKNSDGSFRNATDDDLHYDQDSLGNNGQYNISNKFYASYKMSDNSVVHADSASTLVVVGGKITEEKTITGGQLKKDSDGNFELIHQISNTERPDPKDLFSNDNRALLDKFGRIDYKFVTTPGSYEEIQPNDSIWNTRNVGQQIYVQIMYPDSRGASLNFTNQYVPVKLVVQGIGDQLQDATNLKGKDITAHVVNTGDASSYVNGLISANSTISYTDANGDEHNDVSLSSLAAGANTQINTFFWRTTPDLTQIDTNGTDHNITVGFADGSSITIPFKVTVAGATAAANQTVTSMTQPSAVQASQAVTDLPQGATVAGWVDATENITTHEFDHVTNNPTYATTWAAPHTSTPAFVKVHYADGTDQIVKVTLNINSLSDSDVGNHYSAVASTDTHYGHTFTNDEAIPLIKNGNTALDATHVGHTGDEVRSVAWVSVPATNVAAADMLTGEHDLTGQQIKITFADGSTKTVDTTVKVHGGKSVTDSSAATLNRGENLTTDAAKAIAQGLISNHGDLDTYHATYAWSTTEGPNVSASTNGRVEHANVVISYFKDAAHTQADGTQIVEVPYKVQDETENPATRATVNADGLKVHFGQQVNRDDAIGLVKIGNANLTPSQVGASHTVADVQWVTSLTNDRTVTPDTKAATAGQANTDVPGFIKISYSDGSSKILAAGIHVVGGYNNTDKTFTIISGTKPTDTQAKEAIKNSASGVTDSLSGYNVQYSWAQDADGHEMEDASITSSVNTQQAAWVVITYTDGTGANAHVAKQVVRVNNLKITAQNNHYIPEVNPVSAGQTRGIVTHVNAPAIDLTNAPIRFKYTDTDGHTQYKSLSDIGATASWDGAAPDLTTAATTHNYRIKITFQDHSVATPDLEMPVTVIGAEGQDVVFNKKSTNEAPTITEQDVDHKTVISNENDLSQFGASITWKKSDGTTIDWTKPTLNNDGQVEAVPVTVTVHYNDHTTQDVNLNLKINGSATIDASHYTADNISVHYGQDISNDAIGLIKHDGTTLTTANLASQGIQSVAWEGIPNTAVTGDSRTPGEKDLTNQSIRITFTDGSVLTKSTTVKVFSGYNNTHKNVTIVSGDMPSEQDAKDAIANWATLSRDHQATSAAWAEDANGTAMDAPYVTSSTNTDKHAWIKITYSDGKTQVVQVNDLHITSQANGYRVREVTGGLQSHAVDSGAPDVGDLKQYFTVTNGSTNENGNITAASWVSGHVPTWTSAGDTSGEVRLTFADGSSKDVDLNVHLVGINVPNTTASTYRNVVPTSGDAKTKVTNSSSLDPYHATYDWYSDRNATTRLQTTDVANPGTKTVYIGVKYHKVDGSDDGQQVKSITLTINNSSSQYRATNNATHSSITTHVGASVADFGNGSDYVTITKNDGSAVSASDIRSYSWTTPVDTADNARGNQTAVVTITFADSTTAQPDTLTVNVPVTVVKATAHNDIETNHDVPLNAKDQITNMSALNTNNFKVSDADVTWANDAHGAALPSDFWTTNSDSSTAIDPSGNRIVGKKGAWLIVNYKKADGTTPDGTQAIWAPVKIKSDRDNIDPTNTDAYNADHGIYKTHIGAEINGAANFGNVHLDDQIGFRDSHDTPMFVDAHGNATWRFDGFAKANASGTGYTPSDVDLNADNLTDGEHDITDLYAKINLPDGSTTYVKMNHVYVYGGYPHADNDDGTRFTKVVNGGDLTDDQARAAIANNGTLTSAATVGDLNKATGFTWAKDANGSALSAADTSWHQGDTVSNLDRTGYVIISYADGTKQAVRVHYDVIKDSDNTHINTDPTDPTGKRITGDPIVAHVSDNGAAENVDGADAVVITEGTGSSAVQKTLSQIGASIAWDRSADMNTWVTSEHDAEWKDATITYHDGSTKAVQIKVKVVGASRKVSATAGQADVVTNHGVVPDASASINQPNATGAKWNIDNVQWADASGNVLNDTDRNNFFAGNTDSSSVTIDHTTYDKAKAGYILVSYKRNGQPDGTQLIEVPVQIKSDADNIDPNTGITFDRAQGNVVKTHANATTADPASGQITIKDNAGGDVSGWNFSGWATKDTAGHYDDVSSSALATDLNDHSLNADGLKEVNDVYAKITLADGSVIYTLAMKIQVLGGVGQSKTYDHTLTAPAASEGVKNYSAVHDAFDHATYSWVTPDNSDPSGYTDFTDFNTRTHDSDGNLAPNDNVYVKITWGDGTFQYVKAPVTIKGDNDIYADDVTANAQGLTLHVNTPSTEVIPDTGFTTQNIPSNIHVSYDWATGSGDEDGQPDVSTTDLTNGTKTVTKNVKITFTNTNGSTTSSIIKPLTVHVIGGYAASEHQSVQAGELPTAEQAKETIANNNNLSQFDKNNHQVTYEWFSDAAGNNRLSTTDTQLTGATGYKDVYVKITYPKADGTSDGSQMVKVTLNLTNDLAHQYAAQLSGKDITVVKSTTPLSGNDHAQEAVNVPSNLPAGTISSYEWSNPVNISTTGDKAGVVNVKFSDNSVVQVATIVHVVDHNETIADRTLVNGGEIWVAPDTQLDEHHGADQAKAGISNSSSLPAGTTYNWTAPVNTSTPGSEVAGIVKVTFTDGSFKNAGVVVHVRGTAPSGNQASRFVPQGNDLTKNLNDTVTVDDAKAGIRNKSTDTTIPADHRLPSDVQITWASDVNGITSTTGDKAAIVKVTYADHSVDEVPIIIHVRDHRDASQSVEPLGQDIYKHNGDTLTNADAENAITNHADLANVRAYGFENNPVPMDSNGHINIEGSSAVYGANIKITYNDDSIKLVPIFIHVTKDNSATPRPGYNRDADNINPFGKTIEKDMSQAALSDGVYSSTSSTDAQNAVGFPATTDMSKVHNLTWADDNFKNNALKSEGLKSGVVKVTYADGSIDLVNVQVRVISEATRTNLTAKTIYRNYQDPNPVTATDGIVQTIPNDSQAEFVSPVNLDRQGRVINAGTYGETIKVTFHDGSSTILHTSLVVGAGNQTEADAYTPVGGMIIKYVGDTLNDHDAKSAISNSNSLPGDTTYNWTTPDSAHLELTNAGLKNGVVKVTFDDGSHQDVNVLIDVRSMADNPAYAPIGQTVHISTPSHTPLTGVGSGEGTAQNGIANAAALANVLASSTATVHPADPFTWVGSIDISQAGTTPAMIKVSYKDGSSRNVAVNVVVGDPTTNPITGTLPRAQVIEGHYGDVFEDNSENAKKGIANTSDMPAGTTYRFEDASELPVDQTTHKLNQVGNNPVIIIVTDAQGHEKRVATVIHVVSDASLDTTTPIGQNITTTVGDPDHKVTPENGIANRNDLHNVATTGGYTWQDATPDVTSEGTKPAVVKITYADGSSKIVPISVIVNSTTPSTNPNQPVDPGHQTDADAIAPFGKTIEKDMSQTALTDGNYSNDSDAKDAVGFPASADLTKVHDLTWVDPSFKADALKTSGYHTGRVKVTYADGSSDIVTAIVHVISMADRYNPTPRPVEVDPNNPSHPTDPSDPGNHTPGVDPSTVPSGTHTGWPTDPSGHPVIPDQTPGTHPGQIEIHYPDGSHTILPIPVVNPSDRDRYTPTPRPIPVTPGENPSDITNPTPAEPTPGVDHNSVPSGSHTILDPSQPAPDTTTPGTHPVHVIVVYPDGSQSDPIETNIVVPDENTPSYEDTSVGETISPVIIFRDNHDKAIKTLTDKISGYEGSTIPLETLKKLIAEEMPEGYALDMDLEQAWREGKFVITVNHPIYIKIVKVRRQLVLFVDKRGRIVKRAYVLIKENQKLSNEVVKSLTGKDMPKGYHMTGYKKVAKHIDIFVSGKQTKATSHGKLVLYVRKDGKIVKKLNIQLVANKFSKRNAKMHLPKGYKMTGHTHINRHNDVWVIKK